MQASYRGRRKDLIGFLHRLPRMLSGELPDETGGGVRALLVRIGMTALAIIRAAYVEKARGNADASGLKWKDLLPQTKAYSRRHPGLKRDTEGKYRPSSMLSRSERSRWWSLYRRRKAWYKGDKRHAAASAWIALLESGAKTIYSVYGKAEVEILRDTGRLFNSLGPGIVTNPDRIFKVEPGAVTVGTNVPYAGKHHWGDPERGIPKRPLWPEWAEWPDEWKQQIYDAMRDGIADLVLRWLTTGTRRR